VKLIAVRSDEAWVLRMSTPDDENQAHPPFYTAREVLRFG
jgi:hypothetical protein